MFDDDKHIALFPLRRLFARSYETSTCSSSYCPATCDKTIDLCETTLHSPDLKFKNVLRQSILEYEQHSSTKSDVSCNAEFENEPDEHDEFISENDKGQDIIRCAGWQRPPGLKIVKKPPFVLFELTPTFASSITDLNIVPREISLYNNRYRLVDNKFLLYDGLPSVNPVLRNYAQQSIYGELSLLIYFPIENKRKQDPALSSARGKSSDPSLSREPLFEGLETEVVVDERDDALLAEAIAAIQRAEHESVKNIYAKPRGRSYRINSTNELDKEDDNSDTTEFDEIDDYSRRLKHVRSCMTKTLQLADYREFDRSVTVRSDNPKYLSELMKYIRKYRNFPAGDGSIKLGIDKFNQTAVILDGNHRLTCAAKMRGISYPEYVKFQDQYGNFPDGVRLPSCPDPENWPTFLCGCDLGFSTIDPSNSR